MSKNRTNIIRMIGLKNANNELMEKSNTKVDQRSINLIMYNTIEFNPYKKGYCIRWGMEILQQEKDWQEIKIIHMRTGRFKILKRKTKGAKDD